MPNSSKRKAICKTLRHQILTRDRCTCQYCGYFLNPTTATIDHKIPVSKGGKNDPDNLISACKNCNDLKRNLIYQDFITKRAELGDEGLLAWHKEQSRERNKRLKEMRQATALIA